MSEAAIAAANVQNSGNELQCVIAESDSPLAQTDLRTDDEHLPIALLVPAVGTFRNIARRIEALRKLNIRIFIPCDSAENIVAIRVLSSLGIETCAVAGSATNWDAMTDLMVYAVLDKRVPHAAIQPFMFMASEFDPERYLKWGHIYFEDPDHFLHLDATGRVALSDAELKRGQFVANSLRDFESAGSQVTNRNSTWKTFFLEDHPCTACAGWRMCVGRFSACRLENPGCAAFFQEMIEAARQHRAMSAPREERRLWQL